MNVHHYANSPMGPMIGDRVQRVGADPEWADTGTVVRRVEEAAGAVVIVEWDFHGGTPDEDTCALEYVGR